MKLKFIDNSIALDRDARRQIRSHVAKGRNVGKKLNRPSRKIPRPSVRTPRTESTAIEPVLDRSQPTAATTSDLAPRTLAWLPVHWQRNAALVGGVDLIFNAVYFFSGLRHPHELDPALDYSTEPRTEWVRPIFLDEAYFHGAMATFMAAFPSLPAPASNGASQDNLAARVRHHSLALRLVNARLSGQEAMTNETLVAVLALGLYERYQGEYQRAMLHLWGAQRMLDMRGGMQNFARTRPELACKIFRADLESSLHLNTPTRFTLEDVKSLRREYNNNNLTATTTTTTHPNTPLPPFTTHTTNQSLRVHPSLHLLHLSPALRTLLTDAIHTARVLQVACTSTPFGKPHQQQKKLPSSAVHDTFIQLGFRLQAISPLVSRPTYAITGSSSSGSSGSFPAVANLGRESSAERAVCVGLAAFVASFIWGGGCGSLKVARLGWVEEAVGDIVVHCLSNFKVQEFSVGGGGSVAGDGDGEMEAVLWMLFIGVAAGVLPRDGWVAVRTGEVVRALELRDWEGVAGVLGRFPWIEALHGGRGRAHWERVVGL